MSEDLTIFSSDDEEYEPSIVPNDQDSIEQEENQLQPEFTETAQLESNLKQIKQNEIKNKIPKGITLFLDLQDKTQEALSTFINIDTCTYANKQLGSSGHDDHMTCVCTEEFEDGINSACFDDDCINRGTKIECVNGYNSCGVDCANQRFQKKTYANIDIISTDKKGYGVRSLEDLEPDSFIYEYIGEVIDQKAFQKRMIEYDQLNFKHFYFMMLQKNQFIDATRKGSLGRFCNHSCNPNCYVEKWVVNDKLKMGIFTKRKILKGEELTFNYNVDRYGADAQPCYCGEPNCIGFIGGKTQTESASLLPQFISEALGSTIEIEQEFIRLKKEQDVKIIKNDNNINVEYLQSLQMKSIEIFEVNKVMGVLFQCEDLLIAEKLIERIELSTTEAIQYKLSYAHGYTSLGKILKNFIDGNFDKNEVLILKVLKIFNNWPDVSKTYIDKVEIIPIVKDLIKFTKGNDEILELSNELLQRWNNFKEYKKILKSDKPIEKKFVFDNRRERAKHEEVEIKVKDEKPVAYSGFNGYNAHNGHTQTYNGHTGYTGQNGQNVLSSREFRIKKELQELENDRKQLEEAKLKQTFQVESNLQKIIENAKKLEQEKIAKLEELNKMKELKQKKKEEYKRKMVEKKRLAKLKSTTENGHNNTPSSQEKKPDLEKLWKNFFAQHIPNMIKKYRDEIGHDNVKSCAKDIIKILVDKELKKDLIKSPPVEFEREKRKKVKSFIELYMEKFLIKFRSKLKRKHEDTSNDENRRTKIEKV